MINPPVIIEELQSCDGELICNLRLEPFFAKTTISHLREDTEKVCGVITMMKDWAITACASSQCY